MYSYLPLSNGENASKPQNNPRRLSRTTRQWIVALTFFFLTLIVLHIYSQPDEWKDKWDSATGWYSGTPHTPAREWDERAEQVKTMFVNVYDEYRKYAWGYDELKPVTRTPTNNFNGWGVSIVDSIDTMLLMGLTEQYNQAKEFVANIDFMHGNQGYVPFFEAIIRYLGGLLSVYHITKEPIFLTKADDIGRAMLPVFNTTSGLPGFAVEPTTGAVELTPWNGGLTLLSEMATCQMEYKLLAHYTGRKEYFNTTDHIITIMQRSQMVDGLWTTFWHPEDGTQANGHISVGAMSDSAYEYLLKGYLMSGRTEHRLLDMYMKSMRGIIGRMLYLSRTRHLLYVTDLDNGRPSGKLEHLSCFLPGLITLGVHLLPDSAYESPDEKQMFKYAAHGLAHTCWVIYADQVTGVGADEVHFHAYNGDDDYETGRWIRHYGVWKQNGGKDVSLLPGVGKLAKPVRGDASIHKDYKYDSPTYLGRPETIESMYLMWKTTGDPIWREHGWEMFKAIRQYATVPGGAVASMQRVDSFEYLQAKDETPSFFLAETLKYFYLLFRNDDPWPLDQIVFNTEAHPLPVFTWTEQEKQWFKIIS